MIKYFLLSLLIIGCTSKSEKKKVIALNSNSCTTNKLIDKHARIYSEYNIAGLKNCLENYVRLNPKKSISVELCNSLVLSSRGKVISANVYGKDVPTDLKWCVEQAFWKAEFSLLQIKERTNVKFPLNFEYK